MNEIAVKVPSVFKLLIKEVGHMREQTIHFLTEQEFQVFNYIANKKPKQVELGLRQRLSGS